MDVELEKLVPTPMPYVWWKIELLNVIKIDVKIVKKKTKKMLFIPKSSSI